MLFEREPLTPQGRMEVLTRVFTRMAQRSSPVPEPGHMPPPALEAYGDFCNHARYMLQTLGHHPGDRTWQNRFKRVEKMMEELPEAMMTSMAAPPQGHWLCLCRKLLRLQELMEELGVGLDAEEFETILFKTIRLVEAVSRYSVVEVNASSMFALLLMQRHLQRYAPKRRRTIRRRKKQPRRSAQRREASS